MTTVVERQKVKEGPPEHRLEPRVPDAPSPERGAATERASRWAPWIVVVAVLAIAAGLMFLALQDDGTAVTGTSHPLAEVYVSAPVELSAVEELRLIEELAGDVVVSAPVELSAVEELRLIEELAGDVVVSAPVELSAVEEAQIWVARVR